MSEDKEDSHDRSAHTGSGKDEKPNPEQLVWALIGVGIFLLLTVVYVAGQKGAAAQVEDAKERQDRERVELLRQWQAQGQKR